MWLSDRLILRPLLQTDLALLERWAIDPGGQNLFNFFGMRRSSSFQERFSEDGMLSERAGTLMLCVQDLENTRIGTLDYRQVHYGPPGGSTAYELGIEIVPEQRGRGYGSEAQRMLAEYLFAAYRIERVQASTDTANLPEQRALEKAGFTREGVLRRAQWRMGAHHDLVMYSKLRGE